MTVEEMHIMFREIAQQMGMQEVRAILNEDIDTCLNIAVNDIIKKIIAENVGNSVRNKVSFENAKIGNINALRTLYKEYKIGEVGKDCDKNCYVGLLDAKDILLITGANVNYSCINGIYDVRITEVEYLNRTINDFCNRPTFDSPIAIILSNENDNLIIQVYNESKKLGQPINSINIIGISTPAVIKYEEDNIVDCNLPEYLHIDIVKTAANIWLRSVGITSN